MNVTINAIAGVTPPLIQFLLERLLRFQVIVKERISGLIERYFQLFPIQASRYWWIVI